jgi:hypothetical protein
VACGSVIITALITGYVNELSFSFGKITHGLKCFTSSNSMPAYEIIIMIYLFWPLAAGLSVMVPGFSPLMA